jgi:hypothetical protein
MRSFFGGLSAKTLFFGAIATILLYNEFFLEAQPRALGVLSAFFLYGLIPAFWGDTGKLPSIPVLLRAVADALSKSPDGKEEK